MSGSGSSFKSNLGHALGRQKRNYKVEKLTSPPKKWVQITLQSESQLQPRICMNVQPISIFRVTTTACTIQNTEKTTVEPEPKKQYIINHLFNWPTLTAGRRRYLEMPWIAVHTHTRADQQNLKIPWLKSHTAATICVRNFDHPRTSCCCDRALARVCMHVVVETRTHTRTHLEWKSWGIPIQIDMGLAHSTYFTNILHYFGVSLCSWEVVPMFEAEEIFFGFSLICPLDIFHWQVTLFLCGLLKIQNA